MKALAIFLLAIPVALAEQPALVPFTDAQVKAILALGPWPPPLPTDPSNRVSGKPAAIAFGERLFGDASLSRPGTVACNTCHRPDAQGRGPVLEGLFGKTVTLQNGETATVDEAYVRESILHPTAQVTAGFQPIMPTFQGLVTEEQLLELIEYVKSLQALPQVQTR